MGQLSLHITVRASLHHHTISHMIDEVMILHAASKTWCIQISKYSKNKMQNLGPYLRPTKPEFLRPGPFLVNKFPKGFFSFLFFFFCISLSTYAIYLFIHLRSIYWDKYVPVPTPGVYVAVISPVPGDFYGSCLFLLPKPQPLSLVSLKFPSCGLEKQRRQRPFICVRIMGFADGSVVKIPLGRQEYGDQSLRLEDLLEEAKQPTPVFLSGEFHGQRSLADYSPWGRNESDTTEAT